LAGFKMNFLRGVPPQSSTSLLWTTIVLVLINNGWFTIIWRVLPYIGQMILRKFKMADRAWITEMWKKLFTVLRHSIPSKPLLLQWLFNLPLVAQWINYCCLMPSFSESGQVSWLYKSIFVLKPINKHSLEFFFEEAH